MVPGLVIYVESASQCLILRLMAIAPMRLCEAVWSTQCNATEITGGTSNNNTIYEHSRPPRVAWGAQRHQITSLLVMWLAVRKTFVNHADRRPWDETCAQHWQGAAWLGRTFLGPWTLSLLPRGIGQRNRHSVGTKTRELSAISGPPAADSSARRSSLMRFNLKEWGFWCY